MKARLPSKDQYVSPERARAIEEFTLDHEMPALEATVEAFGEESGAFEFLHGPHEPGEDVVPSV